MEIEARDLFMDLEKAYNNMPYTRLSIYGVGGKLLTAVQSSHKISTVCMKRKGNLNLDFEIKMGLRQGCSVCS